MHHARSSICALLLAVLPTGAPALAARAADLAAPADLHDGLAVGSPAAAGLEAAALAGLPAALAGAAYPHTTSVLVVHDGKLVYEGYFGAGGRDVLNDTRSATKAITSLAAGVAIHAGSISSPHAHAFAYLGALRPFRNDTPDKEAIAIEDLLTMSSALDCNDDVDDSPGNEDRMHEQQNWTRWAVDLPTLPGYARDASGLGPWRYCTANAFLLGQILQRATRTPVDRYIERTLLTPLGISRWEWPYSPIHETMTGGGLRLRSRDLAKIAWMLVDEGRWHGRTIVPPAWIDAALTIRRKAYADQGYGYFFWERSYPSDCGALTAWYMAGNGGNAILLLRALRTAVVVTRTAYNTRGMHQQTAALLQEHVLPALPCTSAASRLRPIGGRQFPQP
ncbi:MAG TPA: serine hydrolase [Steroidobacteraceae bacterium]|nr:serine hydrolase [Steroidobacteraceae bacterium]